MPDWTRIAELDRDHAAVCLAEGADVRPYLTAFHGDQLLVSIGIRPFERFEAAPAVAEVAGLVRALRPDRLVLSCVGTVRPFPTPDGPAFSTQPDLQPGQRILQTVFVDAHRRRRTVWALARPFTVGGAPPVVTWGREHVLDGGEGLVGALPVVLARMLAHRGDVSTSPEGLVDQAARSQAAGHLVGMGIAGLARCFPPGSTHRTELLALARQEADPP